MATIPRVRDATAPAGLLLALLAGGAPGAAQLAFGEEATFQFERLNRTYSSFVRDFAPVEIGPAVVTLSSPEHSLTLVRHAARLQRLPHGGFELELELELTGRGAIDADVNWGRMRNRISDQLEVPVQTLVLRGRVLISKGADGYQIEAQASDPDVLVRIESQLGGRLVRLCHPMALVLVSLDCVALEEALTRIRVPLPRPGETFVLPYDELTEKERASLDDFLSGDS